MDEQNVQIEQKIKAKADAGKYLTFSLGKENYGFEILKVREIIGMMNITMVPQVPEYVKGVINLRGKVIPVINLRLKFGMDEIDNDAETCIIVVTLDDVLVGVIVDRVNVVYDIDQENIEQTTNLGSQEVQDFIKGIGKSDDRVTLLLDIDTIVGDDSFQDLM